jgi:hypothetical protein
VKATIAKFCDYFCTLEGGKGCVIGMFNTIHMRIFPAEAAGFSFCLELEFEADEYGSKRTIQLALIDEDGHELMRVEGELVVPTAPPDRSVRILNGFKMENLCFEKPGIYRMDVRSNHQPVTEEALYVWQH